jgi:hypothetical protein
MSARGGAITGDGIARTDAGTLRDTIYKARDDTYRRSHRILTTLASVEAAINAIIGAVKKMVNRAVGFALVA